MRDNQRRMMFSQNCSTGEPVLQSWDYTKIISAFTSSIAVFRTLFIRPPHSIWSLAFSVSVMPLCICHLFYQPKKKFLCLQVNICKISGHWSHAVSSELHRWHPRGYCHRVYFLRAAGESEGAVPGGIRRVRWFFWGSKTGAGVNLLRG